MERHDLASYLNKYITILEDERKGNAESAMDIKNTDDYCNDDNDLVMKTYKLYNRVYHKNTDDSYDRIDHNGVDDDDDDDDNHKRNINVNDKSRKKMDFDDDDDDDFSFLFDVDVENLNEDGDDYDDSTTTADAIVIGTDYTINDEYFKHDAKLQIKTAAINTKTNDKVAMKYYTIKSIESNENKLQPHGAWNYKTHNITKRLENINIDLDVKYILNIHRVLYENFNPYKNISKIIEFEKYQTADIVRSEERPLMKMNDERRRDIMMDIEKFFTDAVQSKSEILHYPSFIFSIFSYLFAVGYTKNDYDIKFIKHLDDYVNNFNKDSEYDGYDLSNSCVSANKSEVIKALYFNPDESRHISPYNKNEEFIIKNKNKYIIFITCYKFLNQWKNCLVDFPEPIATDNNNFIINLLNGYNDTFVDTLKSFAVSFVAQNWNKTNLNMLTNQDGFIKSPIMKYLRKMKLIDYKKGMKYITGTACCGKTSMLNKLKNENNWIVPSRGDLGGFGGKCNSPALVASMHAAIDFALSHYNGCMIGDRGPLDNYLWTFIMPMFEKLANINDCIEFVQILVYEFLNFLNYSQNELSLAYYANHDVLIMVDPFYENTHRRMMSRFSGNDAHRSNIPFYALVQNIVYMITAYVFEYKIISIPYVIAADDFVTRIEDYEAFGKIQDKIIFEKYGFAEKMEYASDVMRSISRVSKTDTPEILKNSIYQHVVGIHK
ncbi:MATH and LRR domain-containing protein PFE0570w-like [Melanaphis sacchari]|uniref:MATH and LRR domain-containing protein PFE0570w-like n=1 Tax=Melanaphis sacchari TaxID=742174 RepID=UPI000DC1504F|nr:MATH and LRR domain-containing protein PFE0570w-like [Melanaphis sacchari]